MKVLPFMFFYFYFLQHIGLWVINILYTVLTCFFFCKQGCITLCLQCKNVLYDLLVSFIFPVKRSEVKWHLLSVFWSMSSLLHVISSHDSVSETCFKRVSNSSPGRNTNTYTYTQTQRANLSSSSLTSCCRHLTLIKVTGLGTRQVQSDFPFAVMSSESKVRSFRLWIMTAWPLHLQASQVGIERATEGP